jgi:hypothetical protein
MMIIHITESISPSQEKILPLKKLQDTENLTPWFLVRTLCMDGR